MNQTRPEVFISYAHGNESEAIAKHLLKLLQARGHKVTIDEKDVAYKDNIEEFEKRLGRGDCIVTIISDKYLRSEHCMFEMVCIERHEKMYERIFPIVLSNARKVYDRSGRVKYQKFWKTEEKSHKQELQELGVSGGIEHSVGDLTKLEKIRHVAGKVTDMLAKMMTLEPDALRRSEYAELIEAVETRLAQAGKHLPTQVAAGEQRRYNLPGPPEFFIGRAAQMQEMHERLATSEPLLLVNGLGGIGKTTLAQAYVYDSRFAAAYDRIFWLFAGDDLAAALVIGLQRPLQIAWPENADLQTQMQVLAAAMQNLAGNNLLVLDNANDTGQLLTLRPWLRSLGWKVLLTSRCEPDTFARLPVDELPPEDARALFCRHYFGPDAAAPDDKTVQLVDALLEQIGRHTLLTELLARAGRKKGLSLEDILERLRNTKHGDPDLQRKISIGAHADLTGRQKQARLHDYVLSMFAPEKLPENQKEILTMLSALPAEEIPLEKLATMFAVPREGRNDFEDRLDDLRQNGWLSGAGSGYKLHPLLHDVVREKLPADADNCDTLIQALSGTMQAHLDIVFEYLPYAVSAANNISGASNNLALLHGYIGERSQDLGNLTRAMHSTQNAQDVFRELNDKNNLAISYSKLGDIHQALGQFDQALKFFQDDIKLTKELYEANPKSVALANGLAVSYCKLAGVAEHNGELKEARALYGKAVAIWEKVVEKSDIPEYRNNLENARRDRDRLKDKG